MLCEQAEKLIPLFAGDDLTAQEADALQQHLEACANCRRLASEFEESRDWLINLAAPQFDEATLDNFRDAVLKQIGKEEPQPGWRKWISPNWSPRFAFAASLAALLLIAAFGLLVYRRQLPQTPKHDKAEWKNDARENPELSHGKTPDEPDSKIANRRHERRRIARKLTRPAINESAQPGTQGIETAFATENVELPDPARIDLATNREMTRIEFQTADPNIRIIWLTPKDSNSTKPNTNVR